MPAKSLDQIKRLGKERGFVFPGSAPYGGLGSFWDYGPLGVEMLNHVKRSWWANVVYNRDDVEGVDCAILMNRKVWQHSGHEATFNDPLVENKKSHRRYRLDHLLKTQSADLLQDLQKILKHLLTIGGYEHSVKKNLGWPDVPAIDWIVAVLLKHDHALAPDWAHAGELKHPKGLSYNSTTQGRPKKETRYKIEFFQSELGRMQTRIPLGEFELEEVIGAQEPEWRERLYTLLGHYPVYIRGRTAKDTPALAAAIEHIHEIQWEVGGLLLTHCGVTDPDSGQPGEWASPKWFNGMFTTHAGPSEAKAGTPEELASRVYLRPETAQGIFMNFKNVLEASRRKVPFGIAQIGKAFRNEITPGNFTFRTREFEQMELEFFIKPPQFLQAGEKNDEQWHQEWVEQRYQWWIGLGIDPSRIRKRAQTKEELAHYSKATTDLEYLFPGSLGFGEVEGIANRTDYDLSAHSKDVPEDTLKRLKLEKNADSVENLDYFDTDAKTRYFPWVIEPSCGATRAMLAFLCEAYNEELVKPPADADVAAIKVEIDAAIKNAEKKKKEAEKEKGRGGADIKHDPVAIETFVKDLTEATARLPQSLAEIDGMLKDHPGAQNLELVKKLSPKVSKLAEEHTRLVLKLHPSLAPIKLAIFPLKKNEPRIVDEAKRLKHQFQHMIRTVYEDSAGIGKLYRRQDEIGTPLCITVDFQTLEDYTVTLRDRDTMQQVRVPIDQLKHEVLRRLGIPL